MVDCTRHPSFTQDMFLAVSSWCVSLWAQPRSPDTISFSSLFLFSLFLVLESQINSLTLCTIEEMTFSKWKMDASLFVLPGIYWTVQSITNRAPWFIDSLSTESILDFQNISRLRAKRKASEDDKGCNGPGWFVNSPWQFALSPRPLKSPGKTGHSRED